MKLSSLSYFKTGGTCDEFFAPPSHLDLQRVVRKLNSTKTPYFVLGAGTNSLVSDEHWPGAVISCHQMTKVSSKDNEVVTCQAGVKNSDFVAYCLTQELTGAEWMTALPGQIGATTRMNARCYGGEISKIVRKVKTVSPSGKIKIYHQPKAIFHGYKNTLFMHNSELVSEVELQLHRGEKRAIKKEMSKIKNDRVSKGQFLYPSCGCVFKNDYTVGVPSGVLLDLAGVRKFSQKKVFVSDKHANFIFNVGGSSADIIVLSLQMRQAVYDKFGVWLRYEMEFLGHVPDKLQREVSLLKPHDLQNKQLVKLKARLAKKLS